MTKDDEKIDRIIADLSRRINLDFIKKDPEIYRMLIKLENDLAEIKNHLNQKVDVIKLPSGYMLDIDEIRPTVSSYSLYIETELGKIKKQLKIA